MNLEEFVLFLSGTTPTPEHATPGFTAVARRTGAVALNRFDAKSLTECQLKLAALPLFGKYTPEQHRAFRLALYWVYLTDLGFTREELTEYFPDMAPDAIRSFTSYTDLMREVEAVRDSLRDELYDAVRAAKHKWGGKHHDPRKIGVLTFAPYVDPDGPHRGAVVEVFYKPNWGLMYRSPGRDTRPCNPNNNGTITDLLCNSSPHGCPVIGSSFVEDMPDPPESSGQEG